jgi:hypothetical protein
METFVKIVIGFWLGIITINILNRSFDVDTVMYRQGQIDALTGTINYELKTHPDQSVSWVKKEK